MHLLTRRPTSSQSEKEKDEDFEVDWVLLYDFEDIGGSKLTNSQG
jgi:hypothetical protein